MKFFVKISVKPCKLFNMQVDNDVFYSGIVNQPFDAYFCPVFVQLFRFHILNNAVFRQRLRLKRASWSSHIW